MRARQAKATRVVVREMMRKNSLVMEEGGDWEEEVVVHALGSAAVHDEEE